MRKGILWEVYRISFGWGHKELDTTERLHFHHAPGVRTWLIDGRYSVNKLNYSKVKNISKISSSNDRKHVDANTI